ncbi:TetR/AcrR family transcriptional regulator [Bradyrhizobium daqingense]|uniref:TetR/AcrR family transcriptional regulator n=1 Tax=Bradyrhizobium daqingense TaxID=993502 RepID=UPI00131540C2|nr:TetR/AcrR family transcriptional regulator [Bradyrhizobium daqingense]UFS91285.1 TetR/AcrR family transcriptional regulator [Bradyrhizobium daqingense]
MTFPYAEVRLLSSSIDEVVFVKRASRDGRRDEILDVAVQVLFERGYRDASMLEIANRAAASKETLYAWFGDKQGLLAALIERNAQHVQAVLAGHLKGEAPPERVLLEFGRALLELLLGDTAVAINRAVIAEVKSDPALARMLAAGGRQAVLPTFIRLLEGYAEHEVLQLDDATLAAEDFLGLLLGDTQIRRLHGVLPRPRRAQIEARAARAARAFLLLYGGDRMGSN